MSSSPQNKLELFSAHFDSELSADEVDTVSEESAELSRLSNQWTKIGDHLRSLPVESADLSQAVMQAISEADKTERHDTAVRGRSPVSYGRRITAAAATVAALMVFAFSIASFHSHKASTPVGLRPWAAAFEGLRGTDQRDWQVVVVSVPQERHQIVQDRLRKSVSDQGLAIETFASVSLGEANDSPNLMLSSGETANQLLEALDAEVRDVSLGLVVDTASEFDREDLLNKFRESMESPTASEKYFGEMLVIHTEGHSIVTETTELQETLLVNQEPQQAHGRSVPEFAATTDKGHVDRVESPSSSRPVLVVLIKKRPAEVPDRQGVQLNQSQGVPEIALTGNFTDGLS